MRTTLYNQETYWMFNIIVIIWYAFGEITFYVCVHNNRSELSHQTQNVIHVCSYASIIQMQMYICTYHVRMSDISCMPAWKRARWKYEIIGFWKSVLSTWVEIQRREKGKSSVTNKQSHHKWKILSLGNVFVMHKQKPELACWICDMGLW